MSFREKARRSASGSELELSVPGGHDVFSARVERAIGGVAIDLQ